MQYNATLCRYKCLRCNKVQFSTTLIKGSWMLPLSVGWSRNQIWTGCAIYSSNIIFKEFKDETALFEHLAFISKKPELFMSNINTWWLQTTPSFSYASWPKDELRQNLWSQTKMYLCVFGIWPWFQLYS